MAKQDKGKVFIILSILSLIVLIPLLRAKPPEVGGEVMNTEFTRINGLLR